jgi:Ca-activated chloride channel family protein
VRFAQPYFLWVMLLAIPALAGFFFWTWRIKQKLISQFVQSRLLANLTVGVSHKRQIFRLVLLVIAVTFVFLALARPQWGFAWEEAKQQGLDIIVAIDTSRSMLAEDVAPNRLTRAKLAALDLMRLAKTDRLGLVAFAGTAFLQAPLTLDEQAFRQSVESLDVGVIPQPGTSISDAIRTTVTAFEKGNDNHKVMVLFTDGEDHDIDTETKAAVQEAAKAGLQIFTIGVGTPKGELIRVKDDQGQLVFVKDDEGNVVKSQLNENLLREIATTTKGSYLPLQGANPMDVLYQQALSRIPKSESMTKLTRVFEERYHWPLVIAMALLIVEVFLPERRRVRRELATKAAMPEAAAIAAVLLIALAPLAVTASPSSAYRQYNQGKFDDSMKEYERLAEQTTNDYRLHYNAGTAAYRAKELKSAVDHFSQALNSPEIASDLKAQQQSFYNLGNTLYELGVPMSDQKKQEEMWQHSIESYDHALQLNPQDPDAKNNIEFVKKRLQELKQQQQQQKQQQGDKNKDDQKDQQQQQDAQQNQKDKNGKDQQQQQAKDEQQKKDQQAKKDEQQKKDQEQQQQQAQGKKDEKKDKGTPQTASDDKRGKEPESSDEAQAYYGRMSPQQARQLLDADRDDEKALAFSPENKPKPQGNRKLKDW